MRCHFDRRLATRTAWLLAAACAAFTCGCDDDSRFACANGACLCEDDCEIHCAAPPCHVECEGPDTACAAECGNGSCRCGAGAACTFACHSPPCHVTCEGATRCSGTCANGTCECGPNSRCRFACADGNCTAHCASGSNCVLECGGGRRAGEQGCDFRTCAAGEPTICPGGRAIACGAPCPGADAG